MDLGLSGKSAIVTGASRGIGLACATALALEGCNIVMVARDPKRLIRASNEVDLVASGTVTTHVADLSLTKSVLSMIERFSDADILVNNAGAIPGGSIDQIDGDTWRSGWESKVFGYIDSTRAMLEHMYRRGSGVIVNVIGTGGLHHSYEYVAGSTGNAALMAFTDAVGSRSVDFGVRVVGVNPGSVDTDRFRRVVEGVAANDATPSTASWAHFVRGDLPYGRPARPDEVGDLVAFLTSSRASYISGTVFTIDGGRIFR